MSLLFFDLFGCGDKGLETPVEKATETNAPPVIDPYKASEGFINDAMPLVAKSYIEQYETELNKFNPVTVSTDSRTLPQPSSDSLDFDKYTFSLKENTAQPLYAINTCYLYWLHNGMSYPDHMGGAVTGADENILILKPVASSLSAEWIPGKVPALTECVYLDCIPDEEIMKILIARSATEKYHQKIYQNINAQDFNTSSDWVQSYFELFRDHPEVPIVIYGGEQIGMTNGGSLSIYFKMDNDWSGHQDQVKNFFHYYQRYYYLIGHPLIALMEGYSSVKLSSVDVVRFLIRNNEPLWLRKKTNALEDFFPLATSINPEYHPLALNMEEHPQRLAVPRPFTGTLPIQNLDLRNDHFYTLLKISNPLSLDIEISGFDPSHLNISPTRFSDEEKVIEISAAENLPLSITETMFSITEKKEDANEIINEIKVCFNTFKTISAKFHILSDKDTDGNINHQASMNEQKLREIIAYANEILGRQTNTFIIPVTDNTETVLFNLEYETELGDPITSAKVDELAEHIFEEVSDGNDKKVNIVFVWNYSRPSGNALGATVPVITTIDPDDPQSELVTHASIVINTKAPGQNPTTSEYARAVIHELGHWFSFVFNYFPALKNNQEPCDGDHKNFNHPPTDCEIGDWSLYANLMGVAGGWYISHDQAAVFNRNADSVIA